MMGRQYKNPPLLEAVCEFRLPPGSEWDNTVAGRLYERLKDDFPEKKSGKHVNVSVGVEGDTFRPTVGAQDRTFFLSEDEKLVVQLLPRVLSMHRLEPYTSWEDFRPAVLDVLDAFTEIVEPEGFHRLALRYLNLIDFSEPVEMEKNFDFYPHIGDDLPQTYGAFISGVEFENQESPAEALRLEMTSAQPRAEDARLGVRLDIAYSRKEPVACREFDGEDWLNDAHGKIENAFEGAILGPLREKFGLEEQG